MGAAPAMCALGRHFDALPDGQIGGRVGARGCPEGRPAAAGDFPKQINNILINRNSSLQK
jgi:hypothetical protein